MYVEASSPFEASFDSGESGLVGTVQVKVIDNDGADVIGPTTLNITEDGVSGIYIWNAPAAPAPLGQYTIVWSKDGTFDPATVAIEELIVLASTAATLPAIPAPAEGGASHGPCSAWTTAADVMDCCGSVETTDEAIFDDVVDQASQLLFELSGRLFAGLCSKSVRPCRVTCGCGWQVLSRGHLVQWRGSEWWCESSPCGCNSLSRVKLDGYPVREITEVKIDGAVVNPATYRLDEMRFLTRVRDPLDTATVLSWPGCQNLDLDDTEDGTFVVSYTYGQSPPLLGQEAAAQLACELYKECDTGACALPKGTTRVTRQGIVIERLAFSSWAFRERRWQTGLPLVDAFLNAYNSAGLIRRPTFWGPGTMHRYAPTVGS